MSYHSLFDLWQVCNSYINMQHSAINIKQYIFIQMVRIDGHVTARCFDSTEREHIYF